MTDLISTDRVIVRGDTSAENGRVVWATSKSLWYFAHLAGAVAGLIWFASWSGFVVFVLLSAVTICAGHSVGMHRLLIHRSFRAPIWVEHILVWLGTLVGMAGPSGMIRAHDMRDWHQRQTVCPPHPSHRAGFWRDAWWQMHCEFRLTSAPDLIIEASIANDRFYKALERSWMWQQLPIALALFALGGVGWVLWGVSLRIVASLTGHWMVGHFAHRRGHQGWRVEGLPVQGYNIRGLGLLTFGESWHGNHHAFPHSALLGVEAGQLDPGFMFIRALEWIGLASDVKGPEAEPERDGLRRVSQVGDMPSITASRTLRA